MNRRAASSILGVILAVVGFVASYFANARVMGTLFDADSIQMPAVFADIFERGGSFADWTIAPAPAIVPEYGMYALAYLVGVNLFGRVLVYSLIQVSLLWVLVFILGRAVGIKNALVASSVTVTLMMLLCLLTVRNFLQVLQSAFHFGGFLMQLVLFSLVFLAWRAHQRRRRWTFVAVIALLVAVGSFNDALFVVQAVVPLALIVATGAALRRIEWREGLIFVAVISSFAFVGYKLYPRLMPHPISNVRGLDLLGAGRDLSEFGSDFAVSGVSMVVAITLIVTTCALGVCSLSLLVRRNQVGWLSFLANDGIRVLAAIGLLGSATTVVAMFITSAGLSARYLLPLYYWPCILVPMIIVELRSKWMPGLAAAVALAFGLASTGVGLSAVVKNGVHTDYYPDWVACIDQAAQEFGVKHALGTYWVTKPVQELSRSEITVTNLADVRGQEFWIASDKNQFDSYDAFIDDKRNPTPEFLQDIREIAGTPVTTVKCSRATITIYEPGAIKAADLTQQ